MFKEIEAFAKAAGGRLGAATESQSKRLSESDMPDVLTDLLSTNWLVEYGQIEAVEIYDIESIVEELDTEYIKHLPSGGYLPIGKGPNGDQLVACFADSSFPVGFIRIGEWDVSGPPDEDAFYRFSDSMQEFIDRAIRKKGIFDRLRRRCNIPVDSYDAEEGLYIK